MHDELVRIICELNFYFFVIAQFDQVATAYPVSRMVVVGVRIVTGFSVIVVAGFMIVVAVIVVIMIVVAVFMVVVIMVVVIMIVVPICVIVVARGGCGIASSFLRAASHLGEPVNAGDR
jgi:hypothetical protein